jgi:hypothetical protein
MVRSNNIILWDCKGKLEAAIFASRREAFKLERINDQMGMIAVKVSTTESFDEGSDYLIRQVNKNGRVESQLVFGTKPAWAGGTLVAPRCLLANGADTTRLLNQYPAKTYEDSETRRHNGIHDADENCFGK